MKISPTTLFLCLSMLIWASNAQSEDLRHLDFRPEGGGGGVCNRNCPFNYDPVCGSNGQTYPNFCTLLIARRCDNIRVRKRHDGECGLTTPDCRPNIGCPFNYAPVCGSDGQTYPNDCLFQKARCNNPRLTKVRDGECGPTNPNCKQTPGCPFNYQPVCGSNGQTYGNLCVFQNAACSDPNLSKVSDGECGSTNPNCRPSSVCPFNYVPICGSDGKTYANDCAFRNAACKDPRLTKVSDGECGRNPLCKQTLFCPTVYQPVCGNNGQTYENECVFSNAACTIPTLRKASDGECVSRPVCPDLCPANYDPVCGTDGKTYGNQCSLGSASCRNPSIQKAHDGECGSPRPPPVCSQVCPAIFSPVCGSDGRTYPNQCTLDSASCNNPSIRKLHDGECRRRSRDTSSVENNV